MRIKGGRVNGVKYGNPGMMEFFEMETENLGGK
jgi:hypothetical protein